MGEPADREKYANIAERGDDPFAPNTVADPGSVKTDPNRYRALMVRRFDLLLEQGARQEAATLKLAEAIVRLADSLKGRSPQSTPPDETTPAPPPVLNTPELPDEVPPVPAAVGD